MIAALTHRPAREEGNHRRDRRRGAGDARVRDQGADGRHARTWSTSSAPAATARTPSTSRPRRCSSRPRPARAWPSTATAACRRKSGSADVLEALGAQHQADARAGRAVASRETGIGFMFAPNHHPAMKHVGAGAQGAGRAHDLQHPRAADQSGRRAEHPDGRVPSRPGRHPGARAAAPRRAARAGGLGPRRHGRGLARRGDAGRRTARRRGPRIRNPSGGLRPADGRQPQPEGGRRRRIEGDAAGGAATTRRARRATSSR